MNFEPKTEQDRKTHENLVKHAYPAIQYEYYKYIWLDSNIFGQELSCSLKALHDLGYLGFNPMDDPEYFKQYLAGPYVHDNVIVVMSGSMSKRVLDDKNMIEWIQEFNKEQKKVVGIIIYCMDLKSY